MLSTGKGEGIRNESRKPLDFLGNNSEPTAGHLRTGRQGLGREIEIQREIRERRAEFVGHAVDEGNAFGGLGFLDGVAIDQHLTQRNRFQDMTGLVKRYPQLLGIGIDESTAIMVRKSNAQVIGRGKVHFYDHNQPVSPGEPDYVALTAGSEYDLVKTTGAEGLHQEVTRRQVIHTGRAKVTLTKDQRES